MFSVVILALLPLGLVNALQPAQRGLTVPEDDHPAASLPVPNPSRSFWVNAPGANPLASVGSTGELTSEAKLCIIGSGITGVSAAYHISKMGLPLSTVILEARDFCSGATGRNGGHLTPSAFEGFGKHLLANGQEGAIRAIDLEQHTARSILDVIAKASLGDRVHLVESGHIRTFMSEEEAFDARAEFELAKKAGVDVSKIEWLSREFMQEHFGTPYDAVRHPGHTMWPLKFVTELYRLANETSGFNLTLHTRTPVTSLSKGPSGKTILTTPRGTVSCSRVLHATNAYASHLLPFMKGPRGIIPRRGQVVGIRADVGLQALTNASYDANDGFEYWFPRLREPDGSIAEKPLVILGGGREETGPEFEMYITDDSTLSTVVAKTLESFLPRVFPGKFEKSEVEWSWSGIMGATASGDPFIGPLSSNNNANSLYSGQYIAAGYSGHGMPRTFACAEAIAQIIAAEIEGSKWTVPKWLPEHYLTWNRGIQV